MKKSILITTIFSFMFFSSLQVNAQDNADTKTRSFNVNKGGTLNISLNAGDVKITTWNKNEVSVKIVSEDKEEINKIFSSLENNTVKISNKGNWGWGWTGDLIIYVSIPSEFNTEIKTQSGDVSQKGYLKGRANIFTAGGDITIEDVSGQTVLKSNGGDIRTGNVDDDLTLSTNGGDITTGNVKGKTIISTMGGSINVKNSGKDLNVNTMGGDIKIGDVGGKAEIKTMGGDISVKNISGNGSISTYGGDITLSGAKGLIEATTYGGDIRMNNITGSVKLDTKSGDIYLELNPSGNNQSEIKTMNGGIKLILPANAKAEIKATARDRGFGKYNNSDQNIISDFDSKTFVTDDRKNETQVTYLINGGGNGIELFSINGTIEIRKK